MSWTDERVELLKKLWADGLSASQIGPSAGTDTRMNANDPPQSAASSKSRATSAMRTRA